MGKVCPDCETASTMALEGGRAAARREREKPAVEMAPLAFPMTPMTLLEDTGTTRREGKPGGGEGRGRGGGGRGRGRGEGRDTRVRGSRWAGMGGGLGVVIVARGCGDYQWSHALSHKENITSSHVKCTAIHHMMENHLC